jgi:hypothetical protein
MENRHQAPNGRDTSSQMTVLELVTRNAAWFNASPERPNRSLNSEELRIPRLQSIMQSYESH